MPKGKTLADVKNGSVESEQTKEVNSTNIEETVSKREFDELKEAMAEQNKLMVAILQQSQNQSASGGYDPGRDFKPVVVTSQLPNKLYLTTEHKGQGKVYEFNAYGEKKSISRGDVEKIMNVTNQFEMFKNGRYKIGDETLIDQFLLKEKIDNYPTTEEIKDILGCTRKRIKEIMENINDKFKYTIIRIALSKSQDMVEEEIDLNKIRILDKYCDVKDITQAFIDNK